MFEDDFFDEDLSDFEETLKKFDSMKSGHSVAFLDEEEFEKIIEYYYERSNDEQALLACEIAQTYYPFSSAILFLKAEILTQSQKYGQALKALDLLEQIDQSNLDAVILKSDIFTAQNKLDQAAIWLEDQAQFFSGKEKVELLLELSDVYDESENYESVFNTLIRVINIDRCNEEALQKICFWAEFTNRLEESIGLHLNVIDDEPYNALAWFNLGAAYQGLKMYEKCIDAYEYCIAIDDKFEFAYRNMADAFMRMKKYEKALEVLEKHLDIARPEDVIFEAMGFCWEKKKDFQKARQYYRKASQLSPGDDTIFYKIGETYAREGQWEKAVKSFSVAFHLDKENYAYCLAIGNCLMEMDIKSEALVCYVNAVRLKPQNKTAWFALIRGLILSQYYEEAIVQIELAKEHCGEKAEFWYLHAAALLELGKAKEALIQLEYALKAAPKKIKFFTELNPEYLLRSFVSELITRYRKK